MEALAAQQSESHYKFSKPLQVENDEAKSKGLKRNQDHFYKFSLPLDVPFLTSTLDTTRCDTDSCTGFGKQFKRSRTEWECDVCMICNKLEVDKCVACETPRKPIISLNDASFGQQFKKSSDKWECDTCMVQNKLESTKCEACEATRKISGLKSPNPSNWECPKCMIWNTTVSDACIACETKKPVIDKSSDYLHYKKLSLVGINSSADDGFKSLAAHQKASKWECSACMTQNDDNCIKCVCCEQQKPVTEKKIELKEASSSCASKFTFGFGNGINAPTENDLRKSSSSISVEVINEVLSWECTTCKTSNKKVANDCLVCQSKKPAPAFKFGFANLNTIAGDAGFKLLAAQQKTSKWECSACMTQNDNNCSKCVCCEQPKPGAEIKTELKETSSSGASNFTFGFGNGVNAPTESSLRNVSSSENAEKIKIDAGFKELAAKQKHSKWECVVCMTQNDINKEKCVCCAQPKLESVIPESKTNKSEHKNTNTTIKFNFGFGAGSVTEDELRKYTANKSDQTNTTADACSKILDAQQKGSKWACEACMTQNDNNLLKCACCEKTRTCIRNESTKQSHGVGAAPKFRFGFGNGVNAPTEEDLKKQVEAKSSSAP